MVAIDTDVLVLAYAFHRDPRQPANAQFLQAVITAGPATTVYNVMELLGRLPFNTPGSNTASTVSLPLPRPDA